MLTAEQQEEIEYIEDRVLAKFPLLGVTMSKLEVEANDKAGTAHTDGYKICYSPEFLKTLSDDEEVFVFAHEILHVAFHHIPRCKEHDSNLWNIATDAVINQLLAQAGLPIKEGLVNMPEALGKSAEEMYDMLLERRKEKEKEWEDHLQEMMKKAKEMAENKHEEQEEKEDNPRSNEESEEVKSADDTFEQPPQMPDFSEFTFNLPNHDIWKDINEQEQDDLQQSSGVDISEAEKQFSQNNHVEQARIAEDYINERKAQEEKEMKGFGGGRTIDMSKEDLSGEVTKIVDWKRVLKNSLETEVIKWSHRHSSIENGFRAKLEEVEVEDRAETEVMLDVSGSVDKRLLKEFLRQLKILLKDSNLKVGCFDEYFYGLVKIKNEQDIDNFQIKSEAGWTENWDLAVRSFSKKSNVNKIIFTDGEPCPGVMPKEDLRGAKVIWIVYGNKDFKPCCGKVIQVDRNKIMRDGCCRSFLLSEAKMALKR